VSARIAVYAGSFDPATTGHLDLIERASNLVENVIVAIGVHPTKHPLFSADERKALILEVTKHLPNVTVDSFDGLLIQYCMQKGAGVIVRGLRVATDFEYELQIAHANADLGPSVDTVFLPTRTNHGFSALLVRGIDTAATSRRHAPLKVAKSSPGNTSASGCVLRSSAESRRNAAFLDETWRPITRAHRRALASAACAVRPRCVRRQPSRGK
jgi:pantetheine-phosphate adenylyltransferase